MLRVGKRELWYVVCCGVVAFTRVVAVSTHTQVQWDQMPKGYVSFDSGVSCLCMSSGYSVLCIASGESCGGSDVGGCVVKVVAGVEGRMQVVVSSPSCLILLLIHPAVRAHSYSNSPCGPNTWPEQSAAPDYLH